MRVGGWCGDGFFGFEESAFEGEPEGKTAEGAISGEDAVAGDEEGDGVCCAGGADSAGSVGFADGAGDLGIGAGFAEGDFEKLLPDKSLEGRSDGANGDRSGERACMEGI